MSEQTHPVGRVIAVDGARIKGILLGGLNGAGTGAASADQSCPVQIGDTVRVSTDWSRVFAVVSSLTVADPAGEAAASTLRLFEAELLGELPVGEDGSLAQFQRGVAIYPVLDDEIFLASAEERARIYAPPEKSNIRIGSIHPNNDLPAYLMTDELLGKHFAILGSTGSGKSCSVALILRAILQDHPNGHVIVLDPHNEYANVFGTAGDVISPDDIRLPYWLLNFEEVVEVMVGRNRSDREVQAAILRSEIVNAKRKFAGQGANTEHITIDSPVPYSLSELINNINNHMGKLENPENSTPYLRLLSRLDDLRSDQRYAFMFSGLVVRDVLPDILSRILSIPVAQRPFTILDLSGVPSEIVDVVVSVLCRMIFDFALWSVPAKALPMLLVCEEAHRYVPRDDNMGFEPTKKTLSRIALEGRKYGVSLALVSQRPSELSANILSQCNTLFALRMSNERDQEIARRALPESAMGLLSALPSLRTQEAVVVGDGVTLPMRVKFDFLDEAHRPKSGSAEFSARWKREDVERSFVDQTVERWRAQTR